jgi:hypothetical protein
LVGRLSADLVRGPCLDLPAVMAGDRGASQEEMDDPE